MVKLEEKVRKISKRGKKLPVTQWDFNSVPEGWGKNEGGKDPPTLPKGVATWGRMFAVWFHPNFQIQWGKNILESLALMCSWRTVPR